ncbi:MAG TPA: T9SS type A sorting domain-containing protein, partial [Flavobacteriales bacterium]|nr:T9SS type A sorting domain-containing protein [Flavobacteriales bacterium]
PPAAPTDATPAANLLICSGSTTTLSVTGTGTLGWYDASTGGTWLGGGSSFTTPVLSDTVTYYSQDSTCGESARTAITVIAYSPNVFVTGNDTICTGQTSNLTANGASTYVWTGGPSTAGISISPSSDTTLYVTGTDTNGCVNTDSVVVHIAVPMVYITGDDSICNGQSTTLMGNGAVTYSWFPGPTSASYTVNPVMDATYILTGADAYGCIGKDTLTVDVSPGLTVTVTGTTTICENESTTLTANASGANSYVWSSGPSTASYTVSPTTTTPYSVTAIDTISGCVGSTTITVTVNPLPDVSVFTLGSGATATNFTADSYLWVFCPIYIPAIGTNDTQFYLSVFTADYAVIITDNGCTDTSECVTLAAIGIDENIAAEDVFSVFPNPASMQINIKSNSAFTSVNITDVNGKLVISQESTTTTVTVNTAELQNGLYFVQLMNGSKPLSGAHKLVIEN